MEINETKENNDCVRSIFQKLSVEMLVKCCFLKPFYASGPFLYPQKTPENLWYRKEVQKRTSDMEHGID